MIVFNDKEHGAAIANRVPRVFNPTGDVVISNVSDHTGKLLGGVIFEGYTGTCIFMHQASWSRHWLSNDMLWAAFDYPFVQLKVSKVAGTVPSTDPLLVDFNKRLGFVEECRIKGAYPGGDMLVMTMDVENCRWLKLKPHSLRRGQHERQQRTSGPGLRPLN